MLPHAPLFFVQRVTPCRTSKGPPGPIGGRGFTPTSLARQVGGSLVRTRRRVQRVIFIAIFAFDDGTREDTEAKRGYPRTIIVGLHTPL